VLDAGGRERYRMDNVEVRARKGKKTGVAKAERNPSRPKVCILTVGKFGTCDTILDAAMDANFEDVEIKSNMKS
jgi:hypothetical protein